MPRPELRRCARGQEHAPHLWMLGRVAYSCDGEGANIPDLVPEAVRSVTMTIDEAVTRIHELYVNALLGKGTTDSLPEDVRDVLREMMGDATGPDPH